MPRSRDTIPGYMEGPVKTDQFKGSAYRCRHCGELRWTCWAQAWKHDCRGDDGD